MAVLVPAAALLVASASAHAADRPAAEPAGGRGGEEQPLPCPRATASPAQAGGDVVVAVPALVSLRVDRHGQVVAVRTNTGRRPCPGDELVVVDPLPVHAPTSGERGQALSAVWRGPWDDAVAWHTRR